MSADPVCQRMRQRRQFSHDGYSLDAVLPGARGISYARAGYQLGPTFAPILLAVVYFSTTALIRTALPNVSLADRISNIVGKVIPCAVCAAVGFWALWAGAECSFYIYLFMGRVRCLFQ